MSTWLQDWEMPVCCSFGNGDKRVCRFSIFARVQFHVRWQIVLSSDAWLGWGFSTGKKTYWPAIFIKLHCVVESELCLFVPEELHELTFVPISRLDRFEWEKRSVHQLGSFHLTASFGCWCHGQSQAVKLLKGLKCKCLAECVYV